MKTRKTYIVRSGEVALKGTNKPYFERMLIERIGQVLKPYEGIQIRRDDGLIIVQCPMEMEEKLLIREISRVFGVQTISPAETTVSEIVAIEKAAVFYMRALLKDKPFETFKVEVNRSDKTFPILSPDIEKRIGSMLLDECQGLKVDVHHPEVRLHIHVRRERTFLYEQKVSALGGLPLGTNGKGLVLLSGGIDSPVAAFLMSKRGMLVEAVHFHSYPYTSERAWEKVQDLGRILTDYCGKIRIHSVNLLPIQEQIVQKCREDEITILVRRFMMRIAERIAVETGSLMLITGENLGQVASQTAESLVVTDEATTLPVMRPLIAMDKVDIIKRAKEIGTFDVSILPYEDCCTVFLPKHPVTKPTLHHILQSEARLDVPTLVEDALRSKESVLISTRGE